MPPVKIIDTLFYCEAFLLCSESVKIFLASFVNFIIAVTLSGD